MRSSVAAVVVLAIGCSAPRRTLTLAPTVPDCVPRGSVNTVRVTAQGDFPPEATLTAAASPAAAAALALPRATRAVVVEGFGPTGLVAFGRTPTLSLDEVPGGTLGVAYGPPDGLCLTGAMNVARAQHHGTVLAGGGVLITGGVDSADGPATQVELYDPRTATFALTGGSIDRGAVLLHAVAPLADGGALIVGGAAVAGGMPAGIAFAGANRSDAHGQPVGSARLLVGGPRAAHTATVLADGRVLVAGGCQAFAAGTCMAGAVTATTEIYDPESDTFAAGPSLLHARWGHDAVLRGDGTVLIVGGRGDSGGALPAEVLDPDEPRGFDAGVVSGRAAGLPTGSVLVVGGTTAPDSAVSLWASPGETVSLPPLAVARLDPTLTALDDGAVLIAGGGDATLALYDGRATVAALPPRFVVMTESRQAATRLADGTVLLSGGVDPVGVTRSEAALYFHSPLSPWASLPPLTLDGASDPYLPRRPDRASAGGGQLVVTAAAPSGDGRPAELALVAGMQVADFSFDLLAGRRGSAGAALLVGWQSEASYDFVVVEPGRAVELWSVAAARTGQSVAAPVAGCQGAALPDGALPDGDLAPVAVAWRAGTLTVTAGGASLLRCRPPALGRGAAGVGALHGTVAFDNLALTR